MEVSPPQKLSSFGKQSFRIFHKLRNEVCESLASNVCFSHCSCDMSSWKAWCCCSNASISQCMKVVWRCLICLWTIMQNWAWSMAAILWARTGGSMVDTSAAELSSLCSDPMDACNTVHIEVCNLSDQSILLILRQLCKWAQVVDEVHDSSLLYSKWSRLVSNPHLIIKSLSILCC